MCVCRLAGGDPALADLVRRRDELATWLQQAENAVSSLPLTVTGENLRELKVQRGSQYAQSDFDPEMSISVPQLSGVTYIYIWPAPTAWHFPVVLCFPPGNRKLPSVSWLRGKPSNPANRKKKSNLCIFFSEQCIPAEGNRIAHTSLSPFLPENKPQLECCFVETL